MGKVKNKNLKKLGILKNQKIPDNLSLEEIAKLLLKAREDNLDMWANHYCEHSEMDNLLTELTNQANFLMQRQRDHSKFKNDLDSVDNKVSKLENTVSNLEITMINFGKDLTRVTKFCDEEEERRTDEINALHDNLKQLQKNKLHQWWATVSVIISVIGSVLFSFFYGLDHLGDTEARLEEQSLKRHNEFSKTIDTRLNSTETKVNSLYEYFIDGKLDKFAPPDRTKVDTSKSGFE